MTSQRRAMCRGVDSARHPAHHAGAAGCERAGNCIRGSLAVRRRSSRPDDGRRWSSQQGEVSQRKEERRRIPQLEQRRRISGLLEQEKPRPADVPFIRDSSGFIPQPPSVRRRHDSGECVAPGPEVSYSVSIPARAHARGQRESERIDASLRGAARFPRDARRPFEDRGARATSRQVAGRVRCARRR